MKQRDKGYVPTGVQLKNPDFRILMQAFGGRGFRVNTEREFDQALEEAMNGEEMAFQNSLRASCRISEMIWRTIGL
jgi:thiamine pyrophosphate-dependent acetolactate synthase large subunit-like protein